MADAFSYFTPDGSEVTNAEAPPPPGTQFYKSSQLVPDDFGAFTSTEQGDAENAFRGFTTAGGGGFGGYEGPQADSVMRQIDDPNSNTTSPDDPNLSEKVRRGHIAAGRLNEDGSVGPAVLNDPAYQAEQRRQAASEGLPAPQFPSSNGLIHTPNKVRSVPNDPFAAFGGDTLPPPDAGPTEPAILSPRINPNAPPPIEEGYKRFGGWTSGGPQEQAGAPMAPQSAWSGGEMAPAGGSATRPSMSAGRFGRFSPMGGASPFAQKYRQRFKPLGAPANGFTPQGGGAGGAPTTQVF